MKPEKKIKCIDCSLYYKSRKDDPILHNPTSCSNCAGIRQVLQMCAQSAANQYNRKVVITLKVTK